MISHFDITDDNCPGSNETVISNLRGLFPDRANRDILIDVAVLSDFGIAGNINPVQTMGQNRSVLKCGISANIAPVLMGHSEKEKTQNILERQIGNSAAPCEQLPIKPQKISFAPVDDGSPHFAVSYLSLPHLFTTNSSMLDITGSKDIPTTVMPDIPPMSAP